MNREAIQIELLIAREQQLLKGLSNIMDKLDTICKEETELSVAQVMELMIFTQERLMILKEKQSV